MLNYGASPFVIPKVSFWNSSYTQFNIRLPKFSKISFSYSRNFWNIIFNNLRFDPRNSKIIGISAKIPYHKALYRTIWFNRSAHGHQSLSEGTNTLSSGQPEFSSGQPEFSVLSQLQAQMPAGMLGVLPDLYSRIPLARARPDNISKMAEKNCTYFQHEDFGWKLWTPLQDIPFISKIFLSLRLHFTQNFRMSFWAIEF